MRKKIMLVLSMVALMSFGGCFFDDDEVRVRVENKYQYERGIELGEYDTTITTFSSVFVSPLLANTETSNYYIINPADYDVRVVNSFGSTSGKLINIKFQEGNDYKIVITSTGSAEVYEE